MFFSFHSRSFSLVLQPWVFVRNRGADRDASRGRRRKQTLSCNGTDRGNFPPRKRADFRLIFRHEKDWRTTEKEKQMAVETTTTEYSGEETSTGASFHDSIEWHGIGWYHTEREVRRLQTRIVKATQEKRWGKVKAL